MARRNESILDLLTEAPWWMSFIIAGLTFLSLRYVLPSLYGESYSEKFIGGTAYALAPWMFLFLLLPAPFSLYNSLRKKRLLDSQKGLESIRSLSWKAFEELVGEAYRRKGYTAKENAEPGPDGGIDLVLSKNGNTYLVQCKQWRTWKIGVKVIREMYGIMTAKSASGAIIITSGIFTQEAKSFAAGKPIDLIEGKQLADLVASVKKTPGIPSPPPEARPRTNHVCPDCGAEMVLKTAKRGKYAGQKFLSCSKYPTCKGLLPVKDGES